ncbi:MAG TPA: LacI family DNA-binding transcriptional regulator, partial [Burkholderiaceae bacterium]
MRASIGRVFIGVILLVSAFSMVSRTGQVKAREGVNPRCFPCAPGSGVRLRAVLQARTVRPMSSRPTALPTIEAVAAAAGVSTATVSRALNRPDSVRE